ncbi:hemin transport/degradation HmuS domain-containing protein [Rhizobium sp. N6212]|nr:hemin transport/degradation HmuS domain-containing protein [Rhizobium sp. N6212]
MTKQTTLASAEIRAFRAENPKMRERDLAAQLKISEAALVAAAKSRPTARLSCSPTAPSPVPEPAQAELLPLQHVVGNDLGQCRATSFMQRTVVTLVRNRRACARPANGDSHELFYLPVRPQPPQRHLPPS